MPRFPSRKEPSVLDYIAPSPGGSYRERVMAQGRQSQNVHKQIVPMLGRFAWLDPIMAISAGLSEAGQEILRPSLGPKPAISKAMEDAAFRDRLAIRTRDRQRAMESPFGSDGDKPWTNEQIRHERERMREIQRQAEEVQVLAASIMAQSELQRLQTASQPSGRAGRR